MNENFRFKDLPYVRPDFAKIKTELAAITEKMKNAASYEEAKAAYFDFESIMSDLRVHDSFHSSYSRYER